MNYNTGPSNKGLKRTFWNIFDSYRFDKQENCNGQSYIGINLFGISCIFAVICLSPLSNANLYEKLSPIAIAAPTMQLGRLLVG